MLFHFKNIYLCRKHYKTSAVSIHTPFIYLIDKIIEYYLPDTLLRIPCPQGIQGGGQKT